MASGLGAEVTIFDRSLPRLRELDNLIGGQLRTRAVTLAAIKEEVHTADAVIGAVLTSGAMPKTSTEALSNATQAYALALADGGLAAPKSDHGFLAGPNIHSGQCTHSTVASGQGLRLVEPNVVIR